MYLMPKHSPKRRWYQFSLRTLLLSVLLASLPLSWLAVRSERARRRQRQREVVSALLNSGGVLYCDCQFDQSGMMIEGTPVIQPDGMAQFDMISIGPSVPSSGSLERNLLPRVQAVSLTLPNDSGLTHLKELANLRQLQLQLGGQPVTDYVLGHLSGLTNLQTLWLNNTRVTDAGLAKLKDLRELRVLILQNSDVSDVGLEHLRELPNLRWLLLDETKVVDLGVVHPDTLSEIAVLGAGNTEATATGQEYLTKFHKFKQISVRGTRVTDR